MVFKFLTFICLSTYMVTVFTKDELKSTKYSYIPASKGDKPPCDVQPGETFCEDVPDYPHKLILQALKKRKFDISKFFVDESMDEGPDFSSFNNGQTFVGQFTETDVVKPEPRNEKLKLPNMEFESTVDPPSSPTVNNAYGQTVRQITTSDPDYNRNLYFRIKRYLKMPSLL